MNFSHQQTLQRASSVPTRSSVPDCSEIINQSHEYTQSQQQSLENQIDAPLTPSTTEESVVGASSAINSAEPLLTVYTGNTISRTNIKLEINSQPTVIPNLPGITPVRGHLQQQGWL